jgi:hypothetical protein
VCSDAHHANYKAHKMTADLLVLWMAEQLKGWAQTQRAAGPLKFVMPKPLFGERVEAYEFSRNRPKCALTGTPKVAEDPEFLSNVGWEIQQTGKTNENRRDRQLFFFGRKKTSHALVPVTTQQGHISVIGCKHHWDSKNIDNGFKVSFSCSRCRRARRRWLRAVLTRPPPS